MANKIDKEIKAHPERFDYQDVPKPGAAKAYLEQTKDRQPKWMKDRLANVGNAN